jgi:hypothetical protein
MNLGSIFTAVCLIGVASLSSAGAQQNPAAGIDQLTRWTMEDIARQRAKVREQDAAEEAKRKLPDLSQFGTPAENVSPQHRRRARSSTDLHCTTMNLGDGDSATDCF